MAVAVTDICVVQHAAVSCMTEIFIHNARSDLSILREDGTVTKVSTSAHEVLRIQDRVTRGRDNNTPEVQNAMTRTVDSITPDWENCSLGFSAQHPLDDDNECVESICDPATPCVSPSVSGLFLAPPTTTIILISAARATAICQPHVLSYHKYATVLVTYKLHCKQTFPSEARAKTLAISPSASVPAVNDHSLIFTTILKAVPRASHHVASLLI